MPKPSVNHFQQALINSAMEPTVENLTKQLEEYHSQLTIVQSALDEGHVIQFPEY
jgi:hypothetical protein